MLLTISTDHRPATDLGFLLHKNPARMQTANLSFGDAHVFYPEATDERCTVAVLVEVDVVGLVRRPRKGNRTASLFDYVSDRPYTAGSMLSAAIGKVFGTAMTGRSKERQELADTPIALHVEVPVVACRGGRGGAEIVDRLFAPLGWTVESEPIPLDETRPDWGDGPYRTLHLSGTFRLKDALEHLYVLLPVLDGDKHYWVNADEVERLLRRGEAWVAAHPDRELITRRYLAHDRRLADAALARLAEIDETTPADPAELEKAASATEEHIEKRISLNDQRLDAVTAAIVAVEPRSVVDLGCGEAKLLSRLLKHTSIDRLLGVDVSHRSLRVAARRLRLDDMAPRQAGRVSLHQGGLTYSDPAIAGFDVAVLMEVIEHIDPWRLDALERVVFATAAPRTVIVTTPNIEYNALFEGMPADRLRHGDHRFEWTRAEFAAWCDAIGARHGYRVEPSPIGPVDADLGPPTQMAVFSR
jgi:3' terminal RNA ribose 2'-O-methyltransferase Hen1